MDTVVVPAREDGFKEVFLGEHRWYAIRVHGTMRPQIKYIAAYLVAPTSEITHFAPVKSIEPWKDTNKYVVYFPGASPRDHTNSACQRRACEGAAKSSLYYTGEIGRCKDPGRPLVSLLTRHPTGERTGSPLTGPVAGACGACEYGLRSDSLTLGGLRVAG